MIKANDAEAASGRDQESERPPSSGDVADVVIGSVAVLTGTAVLWYALTLPTLGDGRPGPGLFPGIAGGLFIFFGGILTIRALLGLRKRVGSNDKSATPTDLAVGQAEPQATGTELYGKHMVINVVVVLAAIVVYIVLAEPLGFLITMFVVTASIMLLLRAKPIQSVISAVTISLLMWLVFEKLLLVQLPDGLLV